MELSIGLSLLRHAMDAMESLMHPNRRQWMRQFISATVTTLAGPRLVGTAAAELTTTGPGPAVIRLKVSDVTAMIADGNGVPQRVALLAAPGGSVQYEFNTGIPPFTLTRVEAERFVTLDSVCTHRGCTVGRYKDYAVGEDTSVNPPVPIYARYMQCPCHGSRYDIEGRVFRDPGGTSTEPAQNDLKRLDTSYDSGTDMISIMIPNLALHVRSTAVQRKGPGDRVRMKLEFPVTAFSTYEIHYRKDFTTPAVAVPFSPTADGAADQNTVSTFTDQVFTAYVDAAGPVGFFAAGLVINQVPR